MYFHERFYANSLTFAGNNLVPKTKRSRKCWPVSPNFDTDMGDAGFVESIPKHNRPGPGMTEAGVLRPMDRTEDAVPVVD